MKDTAKKCLELTAGSKAVGLGKMAQWIGVCATQVLTEFGSPAPTLESWVWPHMHLGPQHCKEEMRAFGCWPISRFSESFFVGIM